MDLSGVTWRKSSYSTDNGGTCVEVAVAAEPLYLVRDSKDPEGPRLSFSPQQWGAFIVGVKEGDFALGR